MKAIEPKLICNKKTAREVFWGSKPKEDSCFSRPARFLAYGDSVVKRSAAVIQLCLMVFFCSSLQAANYYWVGGSGSWSDAQNHWATSSGGTNFHSSLPTFLDDVFFDENSFTGNSQTVTIDVDAWCRDFRYSGGQFVSSLHYNSPRELHCFGSFVMEGDARLTGNGSVVFMSIDSTETDTINTEGITVFGEFKFDDIGSVTLAAPLMFSSVNRGDLTFERGRFYTQGYNISLIRLTANSSSPVHIDFENSEISFTNNTGTVARFSGSGLNLSAENAALRFAGSGGHMFWPGGLNHFSKVTLESDRLQMLQSGSYDTLRFAGNSHLELTSSTLQTVHHTFELFAPQSVSQITGSGGVATLFLEPNVTFCGENLFIENVNVAGAGSAYAANSVVTGSSGWLQSPCPGSTQCAGRVNMTNLTDTLTDGSDSADYTHNADCEWLIEPVNARMIELAFLSFDTEEGFDFVRVYGGNSSAAPLLGEFSGSSLPDTVRVVGSAMFVSFTSDNNTSGDGFQAVYRADTTLRFGCTDVLACNYDPLATVSDSSCSYTRVVNNISDSGCGSLREAIRFANAKPGRDTITFSIPGVGPHILSPGSEAFQSLNSSVVIDGSTQAQFSDTTYSIIIDGSNLITGSGFTIEADSVELYGLFIRNFPNSGIQVHSQANDWQIGAPGRGNVISGNSEWGILAGSNGRIQSNKIGTDQTGESVYGNGYDGIMITNGANVLIGGTVEGARNLISGNGINRNANDGKAQLHVLGSSQIQISGNYIGTDLSGDSVLPNSTAGVMVDNCSEVFIGDTIIGTGNLIAGNGSNGVKMINSTFVHLVENIVGTNFNGKRALPNGEHGICIDSSSNLFISGNLVSGNMNAGVRLRSSRDALLRANHIGANLEADSVLPNGNSGVMVDNCSEIFIGDGLNGSTNLISGNSEHGIYLVKSRNNRITGNKIGLSLIDGDPLPNEADGIFLDSLANSNLIMANEIAFNLGDGIRLSARADSNTICENSLYCNGASGIEIDSGSFGFVMSPEFDTSAVGYVAGYAQPNSRIELFMNSSACGDCEGERFIAALFADSTGFWQFVVTESGRLSATATDTLLNATSEMSVCLDVIAETCLYRLQAQDVTCSASAMFSIDLVSRYQVGPGIIGMNVCLNYDPSKMSLAAEPVIGEVVDGGASDADVQFYNDTVSGTIQSTISYSGTSFQTFSGQGLILSYPFRLINVQNTSNLPVSVCSITESYMLNSSSVCASPTSLRVKPDSTFAGKLRYWKNHSFGVGGNSASFSTYVEHVDSSCVAEFAPLYLDSDGRFEFFPKTNNFKLTRDITGDYYRDNNIPDVMSVINGNDIFLMNEIMNNPGYVPGVYEMIAADVNLDGSVTAGDLSLVSWRANGVIPEFPQAWNYTAVNNQVPYPPDTLPSYDWLFIDSSVAANHSSFQISDAYPNAGINGGYYLHNVPAVENCAETPVSLETGCLSYDDPVYNAVLLGDVDGSWDSSTNLRLSVEDRIVLDLAAAENLGNLLYKIPLIYEGENMVNAFDADLTINKNYTDIIDVQRSSAVVNGDIVSNLNRDGRLRFVSYITTPWSGNAPYAYIYLYHRNKRPGISDFLTMSGYINGKPAEFEVREAQGPFQQSVSQMQAELVLSPSPAHSKTSANYRIYQVMRRADVEIRIFSSNQIEVARLQNLPYPVSNAPIDLSGYRPGVYSVHLLVNGRSYAVRKLIIQ